MLMRGISLQGGTAAFRDVFVRVDPSAVTPRLGRKSNDAAILHFPRGAGRFSLGDFVRALGGEAFRITEESSGPSAAFKQIAQ
jgi:hypothetical protein